MTHYLFSNAVGSFVFDEAGKCIDSGIEDALRKKYKNISEPSQEIVRKILVYFRKPEFFKAFHEKNIEITAQLLRQSVQTDNLIIQAIDSIAVLDKAANALAKRLREWYSLYNPELSREFAENERFVSVVCDSSVKKSKESIGAQLSNSDISDIEEFAKSVRSLYNERQNVEKYIDGLMESSCPNIKAVAGSLIGAKLISQAGSLKRLSALPASTLQILGAEKALFRHMKTGAKPPKFGILFQHQLVQKAQKQNQGKMARLLADKISIAAKVDYFKGNFVGDKLLEEIAKKIKK